MKKLLVAACAALGLGVTAFAALPTFTIPQEGLLYHLDVWQGDTSTLTKDDQNRVSQWASSEGAADYAFNAVDHNGAATDVARWMTYDATAFGGLGGVRATPINKNKTGAQWLLGSSAQKHRTVFLVFQWTDNTYFSHVFGHATRDCGIRGGVGSGYKLPVDNNGTYELNGTTITTATAINYAQHLNETEVLMFETTAANASSTTMFNCIPGIGSYWIDANGNNDRLMYGVYGEVIAYDRVLDDDEKAQVKAQLNLKWRTNANYWVGGATGDWNTPANWSKGTVPAMTETVYVENATVTVSAPTCAGTIVGKDATIAVASGFSLAYKENLDTFGTVTLTGDAHPLVSDLPVTEGLVYHLDITDKATIQTNADGQVTKWVSRTGDSSYLGTANYLPIYQADGFGGRGSVKFGSDIAGKDAPTYLQADKSFANRTVFLVYKWLKDRTYNQIFGNYKEDRGLRKDGSKTGFPNDAEGTPMWIDGVSIPQKGFDAHASYGRTLVLAFQPTEANATSATCFNNYMDIGSYWVTSYGVTGGRYSHSEFAEVAVYDRALTDDERKSVEKALTFKWHSDVYWTGAGADKKWTNPDNWLGGAVPTTSDKVALPDGADVLVDADLIAGTLWVDGATITVNAGATFAYKEVVDFGGGLAFAGEGKAEQFGTDLPVTSGLVYHLDAAKSYTVVRDGNNDVSRWVDLSANGNDFIAETTEQTYPTGKPDYVAADGPMGRPALSFVHTSNSNGDYLRGQKTMKHQTLFIMSRPAAQRQNANCSKPYRYDYYGTIYSRFTSFYRSIDFSGGANGGYVAQQWCFHPNGDFTSVRIDGEQRAAWEAASGGTTTKFLWGTDAFEGGIVDFRSAMGDAFNLATFVYIDAKDRPNSDYYQFQPSVGVGYASNGRYYNGTVSEMALYDRVLTEEEIEQVERTILFRHFGVSWTGAAGDGKWTTAGNWSTGKVPDRRNYVRIADAAVTVDDNVMVGILEATNTTFAVAEAKSLFAGRMVNSADNTFATADGATFGYNVLRGKTQAVPGVVTGTGTFAKGGTGTLTLTDGAIADTVKVTVDCGTLDLAGLSPTFAGLGGEGVVTNASGAAVTLTIDNADAAALSAKLASGIALVKAGAGELSLSPQSLANMTLKGGTVKTVTNLACYASVTGVVLHLDASRRDTLTVDANGLVSCWRSLVGDNVVYFDEEGEETIAYTATKPHYEPTMVKGEYPSVMFGYTADKSASGINLLNSSRVLNQVTYFFVLMPKQQSTCPDYPKDDIGSSAGPYGEAIMSGHVPFYRWVVGSDCWNVEANREGHYINGLSKKIQWTGGGSTYYGAQYCGYAGHGAADPHVICARTYDSSPLTSGTLGGWFVSNWSGGKWRPRGSQYKGAVCEMIVLDREVTAEEREAITASLTAKWGIAPEAAQAFPKPGFTSLTYDAADVTAMPKFIWSDALDLGTLDLVFNNADNVTGNSAIIEASPLTGTPKSVTGLGEGKTLKQRANALWFKLVKGFILILK